MMIARYKLTPGVNIIKAPIQDILKVDLCDDGIYIQMLYNDQQTVEAHEFVLVKTNEKIMKSAPTHYFAVGTVKKQEENWCVFKKYSCEQFFIRKGE